MKKENTVISLGVHLNDRHRWWKKIKACRHIFQIKIYIRLSFTLNKMMKLSLMVIGVAISLTGLAQRPTDIQAANQQATAQADTTVVQMTKVKSLPEFDGGMQEFYQEVRNNLKYPKEAKRAGINGKVYLSFIVELDGAISNLKVVKELGYGCDHAALEAVSGLGFAKPAYNHEGKPVRMRLVMPVNFNL